ncbi:MAG: AbrB family transcriptional regulator [Verrucomicrobium sp.]|nr:AbrB family transcriptional regulator [Verrucomicrobium sp.]
MKPWFLLLAVGAGFLCQALRLPAAWLFGPLAVTAFFAVRGREIPVPPRFSYVLAQACIGTTLGAGLSLSTLHLMAGHAWVLVVAIVSILGASVLNGWLLCRWTHIDAPTAFLGTMPGGAGQMVAMSDSLNADTRLVVIMQYARLLLILGTLLLVGTFLFHSHAGLGGHRPAFPLPMGRQWLLLAAITAAGWAASRLEWIPAGTFLVPAIAYMALALCGYPPGRWPAGLLDAAYLLMGMRIGARFDPDTLTEIRKIFLPLLLTTLLLLLFCLGLACWLVWALKMQPSGAYLAATPGGLDSVAAVAADLHADTGIILTVQMARLLAVLVAGPWVVRFFVRRMAT